MRIEYANEHLARICTAEAHKMGLPIAVIRAAQRKIVLLEQAPDERTLPNWKSLNYKKLSGKEELRQIRVNDQYRIVFELLENERPPAIRIVEIDDTH